MKWLDSINVQQAFSAARKKSQDLELNLLVGVTTYGFQRRAIQENIVRPLKEVLAKRGRSFEWTHSQVTGRESVLLEREASLAAIACGKKIDEAVSVSGRLLPSLITSVMSEFILAEISADEAESRRGRAISVSYSSVSQEALLQLIVAWETTLKIDHPDFKIAILSSELTKNWDEFRALLGGALLVHGRNPIILAREKAISIIVDMSTVQRQMALDAIYRFIEAGMPPSRKAISRPPPYRQLHFDSSKQLEAEQFMSVTTALTKEFMNWVFQQSGLDQNGRMPGGTRLEGTAPNTGKQFDFTGFTNIWLESACFEYCYGLVLFIVLINFNRWNKSTTYNKVCTLYKVLLGHYISSGTLPGMNITTERIEELTATSAKETFDIAMAMALRFWKPYYDCRERFLSDLANTHRTERTKLSEPEIYGPKLLDQYLESATSPPELSLAYLDIRYAKNFGPRGGGEGWEQKLESHFGGIRRRLIRRGIELLNAPVAAGN